MTDLRDEFERVEDGLSVLYGGTPADREPDEDDQYGDAYGRALAALNTIRTSYESVWEDVHRGHDRIESLEAQLDSLRTSYESLEKDNEFWKARYSEADEAETDMGLRIEQVERERDEAVASRENWHEAYRVAKRESLARTQERDALRAEVERLKNDLRVASGHIDMNRGRR